MSEEKIAGCKAGLLARFKKTAEEMKKELNFAAYLAFCGPSAIWSSL
jgi:hypothetical protein